MKKLLVVFFIFLITSTLLAAQTSDSAQVEPAQKPKVSFRDAQDGAFDLSDFIINFHGFIPVPILITEPALGGFGGGVAPVFIAPKKLGRDYYAQHPGEAPIPPDITAGFAGYTLNNSWFAGGGRSGTWVKPRIRYMVGGGYGHVNMAFYKNLSDARIINLLGSDVLEADMRMKSVAAVARVSHQFKGSNFFAGLQYLFLMPKVGLENNLDSIPEPLSGLGNRELSSTVSQLGLLGEYDNRDNTFTPNSGLKAHARLDLSAGWLGSDYDFQRLQGWATYYHSFLGPGITLGLRAELQQVWNDVPFYMNPFVDMRGIAAMRYQGTSVLLGEVEGRWDVTPRWSAMLFGGTGKAFDGYSNFSDAELAYAGGTGFRYLIARKLKLRMGVDLAFGSDGTIAYYIVFGGVWNR